VSRALAWIDRRFPLSRLIRESMTEYYAPKNFNFWYFFGSLALLMFAIQVITGIFLLVHYQPSADKAFDSIQTIMYDVKWGWLIRYIHTTGASFFFIVIYLHMLRGYLYGSYRRPRELLWIIGFVIYLCLMAEAYFGYVLPYGNMSYWGGEVITSIVGAIPYAGSWLASLARGGFGIGTATLNRFMAFHAVLVPALLALLVAMHVLALHETGSNNPDGIEIRDHLDADGKPVDGIPFHPYYTVKDVFGVGVFLIVFSLVVFYAPTLHGLFIETYNYTPANPLQTPPDVTPAWYLAPYYAMLRAIPNKELGILTLFLAIVAPFFLPWLDRNPTAKSVRYRPVYLAMVLVLVACLLVLGWIGLQPASPALLPPARICLALYFLFFVSLPFVSRIEPTRPVPDRLRM
jgi:ubiquinol-cytochrome c reductase cytochrome b subunit